ncbi:uncharacterized protein RJT21DRAFT_49353 [Scheffersomyces amazonensis]|uniref:uncharacterized protein n=1 Tax=Scheffersomyces amazonensis TaxID=1078765 RepID=UPI00315D89D4
MSKTREELKKLLDSFSEAIVFWKNSLVNQSSLEGSEIQSATVDDPVKELEKLVKLTKAHTTKVGIIFKPENLKKDVTPAYNTLSKLSESLILLISIIAQLKPNVISQLFYDEILLQVKNLLDSNAGFVKELKVVVDEEIKSDITETVTKKDEVDGRLVSVGKIWSICDTFLQLVQDGKLGLLTSKIKQTVALIEDGYEEFEEWAKNPTEFDDEDPFGFSDDDEEEEEEEEQNDAIPPSVPSEDKEDLKIFATKWVKKIDLVKLLIASFKKSLPISTNGEVVDEIYNLQNGLVSLIDKFIVDLMLDQTIDEEIEHYTKSITKESHKLTKVAREVHKNNDKKSKWYEAWNTKFDSN